MRLVKLLFFMGIQGPEALREAVSHMSVWIHMEFAYPEREELPHSTASVGAFGTDRDMCGGVSIETKVRGGQKVRPERGSFAHSPCHSSSED
jgi:hypothetical protein